MAASIPALLLRLDGRSLPMDLLKSVARVELRDRDDEASVLTMKWMLDYTDSVGIDPLDHPSLLPGHRLELLLNTPEDQLRCVFDGYITHLRPHLEPLETEGYLELVAMDLLACMDLSERSHVWEGSDTEVVHGLFDFYGASVQVDASDHIHRLEEQALVQNSTDASMLRRICRRNGWSCYVEPLSEGGVRGFCTRRDPQNSLQPVLRLRGEGACLDWCDLQWDGTRPSSILADALDGAAGEILQTNPEPAIHDFGNDDLSAARGSAFRQPGTLPDLAQRLRDAAPQQGLLERQAQATLDRERFMVEARGALLSARYGRLLRARRPVDLEGLGRRFSGRWWVKEVVTTLEDGVLHQQFVAERNALSMVAQGGAQ